MSHLSSAPMTELNAARGGEALSTLIRETVAHRMKKPLEQITPETRFEELDLDSLDMAELFFLLEDRLQVTIALDQGVHLKTVEDVIAWVATHMPHQRQQSSQPSASKSGAPATSPTGSSQ